MSTENDKRDLVGTANVLHQQKVHREKSEIFSTEFANRMGARSLKRSGVDVPAVGIGYWRLVNEAIHAGKMDIGAEAAIEAALVNAQADVIGGRSAATPPFTVFEIWTDAELEFADEEDDEEEESYDEPGNEIFGYDDADDNDEAARDYIYKLNDM